jgi:hypothetical protein
LHVFAQASVASLQSVMQTPRQCAVASCSDMSPPIVVETGASEGVALGAADPSGRWMGDGHVRM